MAQGPRTVWMEIRISAPPELAEALSDYLIEMGAEGVFQDERLDEKNDFEDTRPAGREEIKAYLPEGAPAREKIEGLKNYLESLAELFPDLEKPRLVIQDVVDPDWGEQWKKYFLPLRICRNIVIKPTWERYKPAGRDIVIEIDPGMAFGTGQHASTRMCLEALEELILKEGRIRNWRVLDVGTGTGILAITAAKLGAARVTAVDIDDKAVEIARENVGVNQVEDRVKVVNDDVLSIQGVFDMIVANLTSETLVKMRDHLLGLLAPGGYLITSGIIAQNARQLEESFGAAGLLETRSVLKEKEWVCYVFRRRGGQ